MTDEMCMGFACIIIGLIITFFIFNKRENFTTPKPKKIIIENIAIVGPNMIKGHLPHGLPTPWPFTGAGRMPENAQLYTDGQFVGNIVTHVTKGRETVLVMDKLRLTVLSADSAILYF